MALRLASIYQLEWPLVADDNQHPKIPAPKGLFAAPQFEVIDINGQAFDQMARLRSAKSGQGVQMQLKACVEKDLTSSKTNSHFNSRIPFGLSSRQKICDAQGRPKPKQCEFHSIVQAL